MIDDTNNTSSDASTLDALKACSQQRFRDNACDLILPSRPVINSQHAFDGYKSEQAMQHDPERLVEVNLYTSDSDNPSLLLKSSNRGTAKNNQILTGKETLDHVIDQPPSVRETPFSQHNILSFPTNLWSNMKVDEINALNLLLDEDINMQFDYRHVTPKDYVDSKPLRLGEIPLQGFDE